MRGPALFLRAARCSRGSSWISTPLRQQRWLSSSSSAAAAHVNCFPGSQMPLTPNLVFHDPRDDTVLPCFRLVDEEGEIVDGAKDPELGRGLMMQLYANMVRMNTMDKVMFDAQRQGRISFYATSLGEEAIHFGTASGVTLDDMVFGQYREPGVLMWRGYSLQNFADQLCGNLDGHGLGRQTPMHYGSKALNYQTISSTLATQMTHAVGAAYGFKIAKEDRIALCFFGDGAASEGDCHAAFNFAATRECPVLFVCRNNGFAISTPTSEQYRGDGIASRGSGYGIPVMRVDGNDVVAVHVATKFAREFCLTHKRPVLLEAMTYRQGHHSTSDDSTLYRDAAEIQKWTDQHDPIDRTKRYLLRNGWLTEQQDQSLRREERAQVLQALAYAEKKPLPALETLFDDVYDQKLQHLQEQERELLEHVAKHRDHYK